MLPAHAAPNKLLDQGLLPRTIASSSLISPLGFSGTLVFRQAFELCDSAFGADCPTSARTCEAHSVVLGGIRRQPGISPSRGEGAAGAAGGNHEFPSILRSHNQTRDSTAIH